MSNHGGTEILALFKYLLAELQSACPGCLFSPLIMYIYLVQSQKHVLDY